MATLTADRFTQQDQAAVSALFDDCTRYVNAGDWKSWAEIYSEDGFLQPPNGPTVRGRAQLQAWGEAFPPVEPSPVLCGENEKLPADPRSRISSLAPKRASTPNLKACLPWNQDSASRNC